MKRAIILFTRVPLAGQTKTRLMPFLTPKECADIHSNFLKDIYANSKKCNVDILVFYTPEGHQSQLEKLFDGQESFFPQCGEDMGGRMQHAFKTAFRMGYESCVLIGTDIPQITNTIIMKAFNQLQSCDVVIHPTPDGGYYLIGMKQEYPTIWNIESYGTDTVLENTLQHLKRSNLSVSVGEVCSDIDTKDNLLDLYENLNATNSNLCPHTWSYMKSMFTNKVKEKDKHHEYVKCR